MKDLLKLAAECKTELGSIGIRCGTVRNWSVNTRAKKQWGSCKTVSPGVFDISIAAALLDDQMDDRAAKDTIMHELLHTVPGCSGHRGKWRVLAETVNERLGYQIKRTASPAEKGVPEVKKTPNARYILRCSGCGAAFCRERMSSAVKHPGRYRCGLCGGRLKRVQ